MVFVALAVAFGAQPWAAGARRGHERGPATLKEWYKGPVRYLMNRTEVRLYRRIKTRSERLAFIQRFWERRDPNPKTPENEARIAFWNRVAEANRRFDDTPLPGWKTDRGKIFILLGSPDDKEERLDYDTGKLATASRGLLRWHYYGLRTSANQAHMVIAFVRDMDNDWRLTTDPKLSSVFLDINDTNPTEGLPRAIAQLVDNVPWGGGTLATAMDLGRLQEVPTESSLLRTVVRAEQFLGAYHGALTTDTLASPEGQTWLAVTIAVPRNELIPPWDGSATGLSQRFAATAQLEPLEPDADLPARIEFDEEAFLPEPAPQEGDPWLRLQAIRPVPPGRWKVSAVLLDREHGAATTDRGEVTVPADPPGAPRFSGPILARLIKPTSTPRRSAPRPFHIAGNLVVPRLDPVLGPDDPFALFVELLPPPGSDGPITLEWRLERAEDPERPYQPLGQPHRVENARGPRGWNLPPGSLKPGAYRIRFTAVAAEGAEARRTISFSVH